MAGMSAITVDTVHHLYVRSGDLVPYCGVTPGPDPTTGDWHTGHEPAALLECMRFGLPCCITCLSADAFAQWPASVEH